MRDEILPLFAYGTLVERGTLDRLLGLNPERSFSDAELNDHEKVWVRGFGYPFVVERPGQRVVGTLVEGLGPKDYVVLDRYEGIEAGDYSRARVRVRRHAVDRDEEVEAFVYTLGPRWQPRQGQPGANQPGAGRPG